jgi:transcriptional regulator with XRE-family HTH domain
MSIFSENIRYLRAQKNYHSKSWQEIFLSRVRYSKYEDGRSEAPYEVLIRISKYFNISIDLLLTVDIRKYPLEDMINLPANKVLLPIVVDTEGNNFIEIVPQKASMGYLKGFSDPEYIESLQKIYFPFLKNGKYRGF